MENAASFPSSSRETLTVAAQQSAVRTIFSGALRPEITTTTANGASATEESTLSSSSRFTSLDTRSGWDTRTTRRPSCTRPTILRRTSKCPMTIFVGFSSFTARPTGQQDQRQLPESLIRQTCLQFLPDHQQGQQEGPRQQKIGRRNQEQLIKSFKFMKNINLNPSSKIW